MSTTENLLEAFAGESQANRRYLAFAKKADAEGYPQIARLFRAAGEAETIHAHAHLRALGAIKGTADNLAAAIEGEGFEFKEMYPKFLALAEKEQHRQAIATFKNALGVEKVHHELYTAALKSFKAGKDLPQAPIHICNVCGHTIIGEPPDRCPVCNASKDRYESIA